MEELTRLEAGAVSDFPIIIRPVGSHAGHGLEKIADARALKSYMDASTADSFYVSPFIDYSNSDGYFRKYRIIFVDGEAYPCHLAISPHWMIHYYNAPMALNQWMRDEEAHFLEDIANAFDAPGRPTCTRYVGRSVSASNSTLAFATPGVESANAFSSG